MSFRVFISVISLSLLFACSKEQLAVEETPKATEEISSSELNLALNQQAQWQELNIEFMELVGDSRCPKGVQCKWAGNAQAVFLVTDKSSAQTLTLNTHGGEKYPQSAHVGAYKVKLVKVKPYPAANIKIDPSQYAVQLEITESGEAQSAPVVIDVRSEREFVEGHYPNAKNLDYKTIDDTIETLNLAKDAKIYVYCRSGRRSGIAKSLLEKKGYTNVVNGINQDEMHDRLGTRVTM